MSHLTPEAKSKLSSTVRSLRDRLISDLQNAIESTYLLSIPVGRAKLREAERVNRLRLEKWLDEQMRGEKAASVAVRQRHLLAAIKLAAATVLNRLVVIKQMEAIELIKPKVVTGGWTSPGYREWREGMGALLELLYDEWAIELPGLFGTVGVTKLVPIPAVTLRAVIEALDAPELVSAWRDDTTLGWVYQYWNDPEREDLDKKLNAGGKVEPHEIASKTQMFTERYMVEWLLQNSLGQQWLGVCDRHNWIPEAQSDGTLARLEERRSDWRSRREAGEVALDALMPIETEMEKRWKYWVRQPLVESQDLESIRSIKILDPACGSGHFLVIAIDLLFAMYREEASHRGEVWSDQWIVESILENNLYGVDIDPRAVQIAAAALVLKAKGLCCEVSPRRLNLVASNLQMAMLAVDDPALVELRSGVLDATGIPEALTNRIVQALKGADYWGSLLKVDREVDQAIAEYERSLEMSMQTDLFTTSQYPNIPTPQYSDSPSRKDLLLERLERFLNLRTSGDDLGLRLRGEQLAAGVRFIRLVREGMYDLVIGNPPYQGASKMADAKFLAAQYPKGKADLYAAFLERGLQLVKPGGISAMLTMRNWMFIQQFSAIREYLLEHFDLRILGDFDRGAFDEVPNEVLAVTLSVFQNAIPNEENSVATQPTALDDNAYDRQRTNRKRAAVLAQVGRFEFRSDRFRAIKEQPIVYWWDEEFIDRYSETPKLGDETKVRAGMQTSNNIRYLRLPWEIHLQNSYLQSVNDVYEKELQIKWVPYVKGAEGKKWFEPLDYLILWENSALEKQVMFDFFGSKGGGNGTPSRHLYFKKGVSYSTIGAEFSARIRRYRSVFDISGASVFPENAEKLVILMNSTLAKSILAALNPTVNFQTSDIERLPLFSIESADEIFAQLETAFTQHEAARETSVEFRHPGSTCWPYAQAWAQQAVDRPAGAALPTWNPTYETATPEDWLSYSIGIALGRFSADAETLPPRRPAPNSGGAKPLESIQSPPEFGDLGGLPHGILYLSTYRDTDSLNHPAAAPIHQAWEQHSGKIAKTKTLRDWLRTNFFKDTHLKRYDQRPIYFPLSSTKLNFVAHISIHRWADDTLTTLLADLLIPELTQLEGELADLLDTRLTPSTDRKAQNQADDRYTLLTQLQGDLQTFIALIRQCADQGPPPAHPKDPDRADARYVMNLDDGVMINSAALWPLLEPQGWKKPKTWWSELCTAQGKKDYDWSHLAARYFPDRVDTKCQTDPSLAVAHSVFWKYHPAKAYEWELRLQDEIAIDFTIDEPHSDQSRQDFETAHPETVLELKEKEEKRRDRKRKKAASDEDSDDNDLGPLFGAESESDD